MSIESRATRKFNLKVTGKIDKWDINDMKWKLIEWLELNEEDLMIEIEEVEE